MPWGTEFQMNKNSNVFNWGLRSILLLLALPLASQARAVEGQEEAFDLWKNSVPISESEHVRVLGKFANEIEQVNNTLFKGDGRTAVLAASNFVKVWDVEGLPIYLVHVIQSGSGVELSPMMLYERDGTRF